MLKEKLNKTACLFLQISLDEKFPFDRYDSLSCDAIASFENFHKDVDIFFITNENLSEYVDLFNTKETVDIYDNLGILKFILARHIMSFYGYEKIMSFGVDTITCCRLDEFMDDSTDILATLNYPCQESTEYWKSPYIKYEVNGKFFEDHGNINADVVCFNNIKALDAVIQLSIDHFSYFAEQGSLNEMAWVTKTYNTKIVDFPYPTSQVVYNARSKGVPGTNMIKNGVLAKLGSFDGRPSPTTLFNVKEGKLYTHDGKKICVFHYVEGLGGRPIKEFNEVLEDFKTWFNPETINFFRENCSCKLFDKKLT